MKHIYFILFVLICGSLVAQPANDLCSAAQSITPNGTCVSGTTLAAGDSWTGTVGCQASGGTHPDVWYSFVSTGNSYVGTVTTSGSWSGNVEFTLVSGDCVTGFTLIGNVCGASPLAIDIPGLAVGATYYFTVSEKGTANAGPFQVCSSTPLATIPSNDDCSTPTSLGTLPAPGTCGSGVQSGTAVVVAGTNVAATEETPYVSLTGCGMASPANSVWYSFVQPVRGYGVTINVSGGTLANPNIALWSGTSCSSLSGVNCIVGSGNAATLTVSNGMIPGQTYYIQLSGNTGESGTYNLSVNAFQDCSDCLSASSLTVSPLPVNGMYDPGQTVSFCFHIDRWTQTVNNWLHGVQMAFGPGWDLTALTTTPPAAYVSTTAFWGAGTPASCGYWSYYSGGTTSSASGVAWPAGFYFNGVYTTDIFGYPTGCTSNGAANSPGNNFGDGVSASGLVITPPANQWNFCWTVKVKTGCNPGMSLSVAVNTSGDGESGSWTSIGCTNDPAVNFTAQISCCPPTMSSTGTCAGLSNGTATATPDGAAAPYTYSWSAGGQNTQTITGLAAGTYTVTVVDANLCTATASVSVATNANPTLAPTASPAAICNGASTTLAANATAGSGSISTYAWSTGLAGSVSGGSVSPTTNTTYTVTVTNSNACTATGTVAVTVNAKPTVAPTVNPTTICNGQITTLTSNATAGSGSISTYAWSSGLAGNVASGTVSPTTNTTYTVTVTNSNSCTVTGTVSVTVNANPTVAPTVSPTTICNGQSTTLAANAVAGSGSISTYAWSSGLAGNVSGGSISPTTNTTYTVTVTNSNSCTVTGTVSVMVNALPTVAPTATPATICNGQSATLAANATAGSGSISTYAWSSGLAGSIPSGSVSPTTNTTYTVTVTNSNGCTATASISLTVNAKPTVAPTATPAIICNGQSTTLAANATAGSGSISTYAWSSGLAGNVASGSVSPTTNTTYTVTVTNSNSCTVTGTVSVTVNVLPTVAPTATPATICNGQSTTLVANATAGSGSISTYAWSSGLAGNISGGSVSPTANTTYTVTVTNSNSCTVTGTVSVTVNALPTVAPTATPATICNGQSTTLAANATAGSGSISTYAWSSGLAGNVASGSVSPTTNTTYTVTVTNSNSCTVTGTVSVTVNALPTVGPTATPATICNGQSTTLAANATAGSGSISTYAWSSGLAGNVASGSVSPTTNTTYTVTITNSNSCTVTGTVSVTVNALPTVAPTATPAIICNGQSTTLAANATAGSGAISTYAWSSGLAGNVSGGSVSPTINTTYTVTVTNSNSCTATASIAVTVNAKPTVAPTATPTTICNGQSTTLAANATAGSGAISTYAWSSGLAGNIAGGSVSPTTNTTYTITVTNSNSCTVTGTVSVTVNALPTVAPTATPAVICNGQSTTLAANATAGSGAISTYAWSSGLAGNVSGGSVSPTTNITYTVTVTNSNTCTATASVSIIVNPLPSPTASNTGPYCATSTIQLNAVGGASYAWSGPTAFANATQNPTRTNSTLAMAGTYTVTVTDANGCSAMATTSVVVNSSLSPVASNTGPYCVGGTVQLNVAGGNSYSWSGPNSFSDATQNPTINNAAVLISGIYSVTATDLNGCSGTASTTVTVNANPTVAPMATPSTICNGQSTTLAANATAGSGTISTYAWSSGLAGNVSAGSVSPTINTTYTVTVTNSNSCTVTGTVSVTVNANPTVAPTVAPNPICNGRSTTLTANATTGSGSISTYAWSSGLAGNVASGSVSPTTNSTYTVTVTNSNSCTVTGTVSVTVNALPTVAPTATPATICNGQSTTLVANATAGSGSISTYAWSSGLAGNISGGSVSPTANTTYTVTVTNSNSCTVTGTVSVTVNALPTVGPTATPATICNGQSTTLAANATAGSGSISTYAWSSGLAGNVASGSVSPTTNTTYTVTVTNSNSCTVTGTVSVTVNALPTVGPTATPATICNGQSTTLAANATAGSGSISTYAWSSGLAGNVTGGSVYPTANTTYNVTVTNSNTCTATASVTVTVNPLPIPSASNTGPYCVGAAIQLNSSGGNTYLWSGPNTYSNSTQNPSVANSTVGMSGTYSVTVTDLNGCTATASTSVTVNALPVPSASNTGPYCVATTIQLNSSGGTSYSWSGPVAFTSAAQNPTITTATLGMAGNYAVAVTDANGCSATASTSVTINNSLSPVASNTGAYCAGATIQLNVTGGINFSWSGPNAFVSATQNPSLVSSTVGMSGTYSVTATDANGCSGTSSTTVIVHPLPVPSASNTGPYCAGISIHLNSSGGTSYTWSGSNAYSNSTQNPTLTNSTVAMSGIYSVTVTDINSCTATASTTVVVNALPVPSASNTGPYCAGLTVQLSSSGGNTYSWSGPNAFSNATQNPSIANSTNTLTGVYAVTVTDLNNCSATASTSVTVNAIPTVAPSATNPVICNGGNTTLAANAGAGSGTISTYVWSSGLAGNVSGGSVSPTTNTTYNVTVTNSNSCTVTASVLITVNQLPSPVAGNNGPLCTGATLQLSSSGGNTYLWNGPNSYTGTTQNPSIANSTTAMTGTYDVTVTDVNGCSATASTNVLINSALVPVASNTGPYCPVVTVQLNVTGGNSYSWSGPAGFTSATQNPTIANSATAMSGTYSVTAMDANGCSGTASTNVLVNATPVPSASNTGPFCAGVSIQINSAGGTTYSWSGPNSYSNATQNPSLANATVAMSGNYTVTVTNSASCTATASTTVTVIPTMILSTSTGNVSCNGGANGTINLTASSGQSPYTFLWSNAATSQNVTGIAIGNYTVTVTDNAGCTATAGAGISEPTVLSATATQTNILCNGANTGSITITAGGGTSPYLFIWNDGVITQNRTNLIAGTYSLTVTDNNSCSTSVSATITEPPLLTVSAAHVNILCNGAGTGSITITTTGGTNPLSFVWSDGATTQNRTNLIAGNYTVTATDNNACSASVVAILTEPVAQSVSETHIDVACGGATPGAINVTNSGGVAPYTYLWNDGATTPVRTNIAAGTHTLTVTDNNACTASISVLINTGSGLTLTETHTNVLCYGGNTATITTSTTGGTAPYTFMWNDGVTTPSRTNLVMGVYTITAYDNTTCSTSATINITEPSWFSVSIAHTNVACFGGNIGTITISPSGGTMPYSFAWSDGNTLQNRSFMSAGNYAVTVTDNNSCTFSISTVITEPNVLSVVETHTNILCNGANTGAINLGVVGGTSPYAYSWNDGNTLQNRPNLSASGYTVTITDNNSCSTSVSVSITEPLALAFSETHTHVLCNSGTTGSINTTVSGGTIPYNYLWNDAATTANRTNLSAGSYSVTLQDNNTCSSVLNISITEPTALTVSETHTNVLCHAGNTGSINLTPTGATLPYTFIWSDGISTEDRNTITAGNYAVTVNDNNACSASLNINITEPTALTVSETHIDVACSGGNTGSIDIAVTGATSPYSYLWNDGVITQDRANIPNGNYAITVSDNNGCSASLPVTIGSASGLSISETHTNATCYTFTDAAINITVLGGTPPYTYLWNDAATTEDRNNISSGSYSVSATDNNACVIAIPVVITEPTPLVVSEIHTNVLCNGGNTGTINVTVTGATAPYTYLWSDAVATEDRNNIATGNYSVTVNDNNSCTSALSINITEPAALNLTEVHTDVLCNGGATASIDITATGGTIPYTYLWNDAVATEDRNNIATGNYTVTVNDNNACTSSLSVSIQQPAAIAVTETHADILCHNGNDGWINLTVSGGTTPYTYSWSTGANAEDPSNMIAGTYSVTVNDNNACSTSLSVTLTQPAALVATEVHTNINCSGTYDGTITLSVSGGTPGYAYLWNDGTVTSNRTNLAAGNYSVTVNDANGCTVNSTATVVDVNPIVLTADVIDNPCAQVSTGQIDLHVSGGITPYSYLWNTGAVSEDIASLHGGTFSVTVTDNHSCTVTGSYVLNEGVFAVDAQQSATINLGETVQLTGTATGGTGNEVYMWSPDYHLTCTACTNPIASPYTDMVYVLQATDINGCTGYDTVKITVIPVHEIFIPNAFTPNGDGNNDGFSIYGNLNLLVFFEVRIFNRWGEKVFESNNANFTWDGTYKSTMQAPQVFVYTIKTTFIDGYSRNDYKGSVTLIK